MVERETIARRLTFLEEYCSDLDEAHDYIRIQPEIVYAILQKNLGDILEFANLIKEKFLG